MFHPMGCSANARMLLLVISGLGARFGPGGEKECLKAVANNYFLPFVMLDHEILAESERLAGAVTVEPLGEGNSSIAADFLGHIDGILLALDRVVVATDKLAVQDSVDSAENGVSLTDLRCELERGIIGDGACYKRSEESGGESCFDTTLKPDLAVIKGKTDDKLDGVAMSIVLLKTNSLAIHFLDIDHITAAGAGVLEAQSRPV